MTETRKDTVGQTADALAPPPPKHTRVGDSLKALRKAPLSAKFGILVIAFYVFIALFAPWLTSFGESEIVAAEYELWGTEVDHTGADGVTRKQTLMFGTDNLGRDMMTRLVYGARNTIGIAFVTTCIAFLLGGIGGILAATLGGWLDQIFSRVVDILMAIPALIFALLLLTIFGTSVITLVLIIAVLDSTRVYRLSRAVSLNVVVMDFVEAARLRGEGLGWITLREILPNIMPPLVAEFGLRFCF
ncbi:MAG: ABC transporter permease, partial [Proteobacteria bacterium]